MAITIKLTNEPKGLGELKINFNFHICTLFFIISVYLL